MERLADRSFHRALLRLPGLHRPFLRHILLLCLLLFLGTPNFQFLLRTKQAYSAQKCSLPGRLRQYLLQLQYTITKSNMNQDTIKIEERAFYSHVGAQPYSRIYIALEL